MKSKTILVSTVLGASLLGFAGLWAFVVWANLYKGEREGRLFYLPAFALTADPTPVEFTIRDRRFRVPKSYLLFKSAWAGGATDSIFLQALLPSMEPPSEWNLQEFRSAGWNHEILITIENAKNRRELESVDEWYLGRIRADTKIEVGHGLVRYDFVEEWRGDQLYAPLNRHPQIRYFTCSVEDEFVKSPSCEAFFYWDSKIHVDYTFSKNYLPRWEQVHDGVMRLVDLLMLP